MEYNFVHDHGTNIHCFLETDEGYNFLIPTNSFDLKETLSKFVFNIKDQAMKIWEDKTNSKDLVDALEEAINMNESLKRLKETL